MAYIVRQYLQKRMPWLGSRFSSGSAVGRPIMGVRGEMLQRVKRPISWARVCSQSFQPAVPARTASLRMRSCSDQTLTGSLVHQNSVPSVHMHRRITAILRATATRAFLEPIRRASRVPQALSGDQRCTLVRWRLHRDKFG
jgi:hypothetical protein